MNLQNITPYVADFAPAMDRHGRKFVLVVAKATYRLPLGGELPQLMPVAQPLILADTATGEPGLSSPLQDCDFVLCKPRCEVLLLGSAYAPRGVATAMVEAGFKVGTLTKLLRVHGPRCWRNAAVGVAPGEAAPFLRQPLSYDIAFGGTPLTSGGEPAPYMPNPVGLGYAVAGRIDGLPMAQTEELAAPVQQAGQAYRPMSFGPLGRHWADRACFAGTYDAHWQQHVFPFLPADFDERYFQSAPPDQQLEALTAGMPVTLLNLTHPALTPSGRLDFVLPTLDLEVAFYPQGGEPVLVAARADTLVLQPDLQCFTVIWRAAQPLRRDISELDGIDLRIPPARAGTLAQPAWQGAA